MVGTLAALTFMKTTEAAIITENVIVWNGTSFAIHASSTILMHDYCHLIRSLVRSTLILTIFFLKTGLAHTALLSARCSPCDIDMWKRIQLTKKKC